MLEHRNYQQNLERMVDQQATRLKELFMEGVQTLVHALDAKDPYTRGHSARVSLYAERMATRMGFTGQGLEDIRLGAELHDIGKIGTRESVLRKPGPAHGRRVHPYYRAHRPWRAHPRAAGAGEPGRPLDRALTP